MKKGIILINAYTQSENELYQPQRLREEFEKLGVRIRIVRNGFFAERFLPEEADFCVYLDKDKYCARLLEEKIRLFNRAEAIETCDDKMLTLIALRGVAPMPNTISGPLCYTPEEPIKRDMIDYAEAQFGFPMVVKECYGSLGKGVYMANTRQELEGIAERVKCKPHLFQQCISESFGRDLRVIVIGGKTVAAMKRVSQGDFRSNAELGGKGEPFEIDEDGARLCERIAERLNLDYCGIDLLFGKDGYLLCEVNSNAFFKTLEQVTGINVAHLYARHIIHEIYGESL